MKPNFTMAEFACGCGCKGTADPVVAARLALLIAVLEGIRSFLGNRKITIHSGFRCAAFNLRCKGSRKSQHLQGLAADIKVAGLTPHEVQTLLAPVLATLGIRGFGRYLRFTHIDIRPGRRASWTG
jgi:uncharacterized protein YcbK (DUF882 family)